MADLYQELGVSKSASDDEVKKAYRKLAAKLHPDRNQNNPAAEERFKRVTAAYNALSDPKKRRLYDQYGEVGLREGFNPGAGGFGGGSGFEDIFNSARGAGIGDIFGDLFGGGRGSRRRSRRSPDLESEVTVEFVSAVRGAELELSIQGGRTVKVRIPAGARDGDKLRVKGAGGQAAPGIPPGDLILVVRVKAHPFFSRDGQDLTVDVPITVSEAYLGAKVEVPTITGSVQLKVPAHTQSGQVLRLRGKGVTRGQQTGDLYVRFLIKLPTTPSDEIEAAIRMLGEATVQDVRADLKF